MKRKSLVFTSYSLRAVAALWCIAAFAVYGYWMYLIVTSPAPQTPQAGHRKIDVATIATLLLLVSIIAGVALYFVGVGVARRKTAARAIAMVLSFGVAAIGLYISWDALFGLAPRGFIAEAAGLTLLATLLSAAGGLCFWELLHSFTSALPADRDAA